MAVALGEGSLYETKRSAGAALQGSAIEMTLSQQLFAQEGRKPKDASDRLKAALL